VVAALTRQLALPDEKAARARLEELTAQLRHFADRLAAAEDEEDERLAALRIAILSHWPVLDDPWHELFPRTFRKNRDAIRRFVAGSKVAARYRKAGAQADRLAAHTGRLRLRATAVRRLVNAYDTIDLASRLHAAGGPAWEHYERLLACERGVPGAQSS
jgi:hypothetical protein